MIREAEIRDLKFINDIYNQSVSAIFETADLTAWTEEQRLQWYQSCDRTRYPILIVEEVDQVKGWLSFSPYRNGREALRYTTEISYYIHKDFRRKGLGQALVKHALEAAKMRGFRIVFAIILDKNSASIRLLQSMGFKYWGNLPEVADFGGETCGHTYLGKRI